MFCTGTELVEKQEDNNKVRCGKRSNTWSGPCLPLHCNDKCKKLENAVYIYVEIVSSLHAIVIFATDHLIHTFVVFCYVCVCVCSNL